MIIKRLRASFGKLNNEEICFSDGLNVIALPNESGKSTWCAFIKAMLYGIDTAERQKAGFIPDKQRYAPWSGAPMEGQMDLESNGKNLTIERKTKQSASPMKEFNAYYTGTTNEVKELNGSNSGEMLTGVAKDVFLRSAYIGQGDTAVTGNAELERRIASLYSSGEETVSYSESDKRLRAWQRKRNYNRHGLIFENEEKLSENEKALLDMKETLNEISDYEKRLRECRRDTENLENAVKSARHEQRENILRKISAAREKAKALNRKCDEAAHNYSIAKDELRKSTLGIKKYSQISDEAKEDKKRIETLSKAKPGKTWLVFCILVFSLSAAGVMIYFFYGGNFNIAIASASAFLFAILFFFIYLIKHRMFINVSDEIRRIYEKYNAKCEEDIDDTVSEHRKLCIEVQECAAIGKEATEKRDEAEEYLESLEREMLLDEDSEDVKALLGELSESMQEEREVTSKIATLNGEIRGMGDPLVIGGEIENIKQELTELRDENDALLLAIDVLKEADDEMQSRLCPELGRKAAEYMKEMTGGKYEEILLNRDFSAKAKTKDDTVARESGYLSAGTADILYLAMRLAICEMALPKDESCPLIIDDALVNMDENRCAQAMKLLEKIAKKRQVLLFTCRR